MREAIFMQRASKCPSSLFPKRYAVPLIPKKYGLLFLILIFIPAPLPAQSVTQFVTTEEKIREEMITISRELGVTCTECHKVQNFKDDSKKTYKVSKEHMKLTLMLRENGFDGKKGPQATCYMCHRGKLTPDFKEPPSNKAQ